jgi:hypothetical protein
MKKSAAGKSVLAAPVRLLFSIFFLLCGSGRAGRVAGPSGMATEQCPLHPMAGEEGFEPSHAGIKIQCLNQLGDSPTQLVA